MSHPYLKFFGYQHLPEKLQTVSKPFHDLAKQLDESCSSCEQLDRAMIKLLEAKDCAVRAYL